MKDLPAELTIIPEDLEGEYCDVTDCPIARALKRSGYLVKNFLGYRVRGGGVVVFKDDVGTYKWANGEEFNSGTANKTGKLVLTEGAA